MDLNLKEDVEVVSPRLTCRRTRSDQFPIAVAGGGLDVSPRVRLIGEPGVRGSGTGWPSTAVVVKLACYTVSQSERKLIYKSGLGETNDTIWR